jgi:hypothetical protein
MDTPASAFQTPPPSLEGSLSGRARTFVRRPRVSAAILAILIGYASILSAVIAWRASLATIDASRYESLAVQQQARQQQIERDLESLIAHDLRFVNVFQEHALAARELTAQADEIRASDPAAADELDLQAQARLDLARSTEQFFLGATGPELGSDGTVTYDIAYVRRNLEEGNAELRELRTQRTGELAERADRRSINLIGVAAQILAAHLVQKIAQVSRTRGRIRRAFFVSGGVLVVLGTLGIGFVEFLA